MTLFEWLGANQENYTDRVNFLHILPFSKLQHSSSTSYNNTHNHNNNRNHHHHENQQVQPEHFYYIHFLTISKTRVQVRQLKLLFHLPPHTTDLAMFLSHSSTQPHTIELCSQVIASFDINKDHNMNETITCYCPYTTITTTTTDYTQNGQHQKQEQKLIFFLGTNKGNVHAIELVNSHVIGTPTMDTDDDDSDESDDGNNDETRRLHLHFEKRGEWMQFLDNEESISCLDIIPSHSQHIFSSFSSFSSSNSNRFSRSLSSSSSSSSDERKMRLVACGEEGSISLLNSDSSFSKCETVFVSRMASNLAIQSVAFLQNSLFVTLDIAGKLQFWRENNNNSSSSRSNHQNDDHQNKRSSLWTLESTIGLYHAHPVDAMFISMDFNRYNRQWLAVGDSDGFVTIWQMSDLMSAVTTTENSYNGEQQQQQQQQQRQPRQKPLRVEPYIKLNSGVLSVNGGSNVQKLRFYAKNSNCLFSASSNGQLVAWNINEEEQQVVPLPVQVSAPVVDFDHDLTGLDFLFLTNDQRVHYMRFNGFPSS